jgi:ferredoxin
MYGSANIHGGECGRAFVGGHFRVIITASDVTMGNDKGVSRRDLLTFWRRPLAAMREPERAPASAPRDHARTARPPPLRPPGMMHEQLLIATCTRCGKCVEACPATRSFRSERSGATFAVRPRIEPRRQPCVLCTGLQCTHVCPSGALLPVIRQPRRRLGTAVLDAARMRDLARPALRRVHHALPDAGRAQRRRRRALCASTSRSASGAGCASARARPSRRRSIVVPRE